MEWPSPQMGSSSYRRQTTITPDGRHALSVSDDCMLKVWDLDNGQELGTLSGHTDGVYRVAVTPNGHYALSASDDHTLRVWDLESRRVLATFTCDGAAYCCAWASNTHFAASDASGRMFYLELMMPR